MTPGTPFDFTGRTVLVVGGSGQILDPGERGVEVHSREAGDIIVHTRLPALKAAAAKIEMEEVRSMGGAARSDLWLQIKADICGLPMVRMLEEETSVLGCAILSAVAVGEYGNIAEAVAAMVKTGQGFAPDRNHRQLYDRCFEQYRELYETLRPLFRKYA